MNKLHIIALVLIAAGIVAILYFTRDYTTYANFNSAAKNPKKEFHVVGQLAKEDEIYYDPIKDPNYLSFYLVDEEGTKQKVVFRNSEPNDFRRSEKVVVSGKMDGEVFEADKILMKCPSKYVEDEIVVKDAKVSRAL